MASFQEIARRKFAGVPVLYWGLAAVTVLAFVAWKIKPTVGQNNATGDATANEDTASEVGSGGDLSSLNTTGTVVVQPQTQPVADTVEQTNDMWLRSAAEYIANDAKLASYGEALEALSAFLNGDDLTYDQGKIRDAAIAKLKAPPEPIGKVGKTGTQPAQKQFSGSVGTHTVKGDNDNTAAKLAQLYWGNADANHVNKMAEFNANLGPASTTYAVGTKVRIDNYYQPRYYTVQNKNNDWKWDQLAKNYGLSVLQLQALNPGLTQPIPKGTKVRYI